MANGYMNPQSMATALRQSPQMGTANLQNAPAAPSGGGKCSGDLTKLTDEELDECLAGLYEDYEGQEEALDADMELAEEWMEEETPEGRDSGRFYVAANPLEHLASAGKRGLGAYGRKKAREGIDEMGEMKASALRRLGRNALRGLY